MPSLPQSTAPPWNESESFRETTLYLLDDPADREAVRHAGRVLHDLALEATREPGVESVTRAELRAAAARTSATSAATCSTSSAARSSSAPSTSRTRDWPGSPARSAAGWVLWSRRSKGGWHDSAPPPVDRVQTGVRMDRRLVKVLKAIAELRDLSLGELLEIIVRNEFGGQPSFDSADLAKVRELMTIYGLPSSVYGMGGLGIPARREE